MKIDDISMYKDQKIISFRSKDKTSKEIKLNKGSRISIERDRDLYTLRGNKRISIQISKEDESFVDKILDSGLPYLIEILPNENFNIVSFGREESNFDISILLEDNFFKNTLKESSKNESIIRKKIKSLEEDYFGNIEILKKFGILGNDLNDEKKFILSGKKNSLVLEKGERELLNKDGEKIKKEVYIGTEIINNKNINIQKYTYILINGKLKFTNNTEETKLSLEAEVKMNKIKNSSSSYIKTWENYEKAEENINFSEFQKKGYLKVEEVITRGEHYILKLSENRKINFQEGDNVILINRDPKELFNKFSVEKYQKFFEHDKTSKLIKVGYEVLKGIEKKGIEIPVKSSEEIDKIKSLEKGFLIYSLAGNERANERRRRARTLISSGQSAMATLNLIIEGELGNKGKRQPINPMSVKVKEELFTKYDPVTNKKKSYDPTPTQKRAIEIALNTPDIAIIQGPPGTGKTTVITAILSRLTEINKSSKDLFGRNLITSYQHDAVDNAVDRVKILGLPAIKYGDKRDEEKKVLEKNINSYIDETLDKYYRKFPKLKEDVKRKKMIDLYDSYYSNFKKAPEKEAVKLLLDKVYKFVREYKLDEEITKKIEELKDRLFDRKKNMNLLEMSYFYKLPISKVMYEDNGKFFIKKSIEELERGLKEEFIEGKSVENEIIFLKQCVADEGFLFDKYEFLKRCKYSLISKIVPMDDLYIDTNSNQKIEEIFELLSEYIEKIRIESKDYKEELKLEYLNELETNPIRISNTIKSYVSTIGATCQQTQQYKLLNEKNKKQNFEQQPKLQEAEIYENVLIDEAARANPLDLLIPMSVAKDRIILVGDHKQLPHIVDENLLKIIKNEEEDKTTKEIINSHIENSMFETLIKSLKKLKEKDGIDRVITLDIQYRMHPKMGDFISRIFYETDGEKVGSGLSETKFKHSLEGLEDKAYIWYDVPYSSDTKEKKANGSSYRSIEAKKIAKFIADHIKSEKSIGKNFGVITFYAKQREEILKELYEYGITEKNKNKYIIKEKYSRSEEKGITEKLRVGSVDSFQGMEFNFVCLSMVRSNNLPGGTSKNIRSKFGFLTNANRLCVAMSRQKETLIMFGDSGMVKDEENEDVKPLREFYRMCVEDGVYGKHIK